MDKNVIDFILKAYEFAEEKHRGQKRDGGEDYIIHPVRVARLIEKYKKSKHTDWLLGAALLHDTLEDTYTSYRELRDNFGEVVASLVMELSTASYVPKLEGKGQYLAYKMLHMTDYALDIKLADRLDNISDLRGCDEEKISRTLAETLYITNFLKENRELTTTQDTFVKLIEDSIINKKRYDVNKLCDENSQEK